MAVSELGTLAQLVHDSFFHLPGVESVEVTEVGPELRVRIMLNQFNRDILAPISEAKTRLYQTNLDRVFDFTVVDGSPL